MIWRSLWPWWAPSSWVNRWNIVCTHAWKTPPACILCSLTFSIHRLQDQRGSLESLTTTAEKGRKAELSHFQMATKWWGEYVSGSQHPVAESGKIKKDKTSLPRRETRSESWKVTPRHMVRAWTLSQSSGLDAKWGLPLGSTWRFQIGMGVGDTWKE